jgi:hypothetical protein
MYCLLYNERGNFSSFALRSQKLAWIPVELVRLFHRYRVVRLGDASH